MPFTGLPPWRTTTRIKNIRITEQGSKAINVASAVQASVKSAVQNMTGITVSKVNVNVVGIMLNKED